MKNHHAVLPATRRTLQHTAILFAVVAAGCGPVAGPDKTVGGALLGAAWGAGAGAAIGNQTGNPGPGSAVGAGIGFVEGVSTGLTMDSQDNSLLSQQEQLEQIKITNALNTLKINDIQSQLDFPRQGQGAPHFYQIYFDADGTNLKPGSVSALEAIAEAIKGDPYSRKITVRGHSDDEGKADYNEKLAETRARNVIAYLAQRGVATDQIKFENLGSTRPVVTNTTPEGRQLNRRVEIVVTP
jgi:outer membrane protein OmpA-like peptidoglycan-associated protein